MKTVEGLEKAIEEMYLQNKHDFLLDIYDRVEKVAEECKNIRGLVWRWRHKQLNRFYNEDEALESEISKLYEVAKFTLDGIDHKLDRTADKLCYGD